LGGIVKTPERGSTGTTFTATAWDNFDSGSVIPVNPGTSGLITAQATVSFASTGLAWAAIGLDPNIAANAPRPADLYDNQGGVEMIVRPSLNTDYSQLFVNTTPTSTPGSIGNVTGDLTTIPTSDNGVWGLTHTFSLTVNPVNGQVNSYVDGTQFATGTLSTANLFSLDNATDLGLVLSVRDALGATGALSATYSDLSVDTPEPSAVGLVCVIGVFALSRRRRRSKSPSHLPNVA
jgi:hypothetical protein